MLATTMALSCIPGTMASAEEAAWVNLEAEQGTLKKSDGTVTISPIITNAAASAGKYFVANDSFQGASSTMTFSRETEGTYDIWALIGVDGSNYIGSYSFTLDAEEAPFYQKDVASANSEAVGDALYTSVNIASGAHAKPMKWVKIASKKVIGAGDHTLVAALTKASGSNNKMGVIDVVRLVPSGWNWTPAANLDAPTYVAWQDIEVEAGKCEKNGASNYPVLDNAAASAGKYLIVNDAHVGTTSTMTFQTPVTGNYDIWAILGVDSSNYIGSYNFTLDGTDKFYDKCISRANSDAVGDALYTSSQLTGGSHHKPMKWVRIASSKTLTAGEHTLLAAVGPGSGASNKMGVMDVVRIVPSEWTWKPESNLNAPYDMRPTPDSNGILHMEAENGIVTGYSTVDYANASGGKYLRVKGVNGDKVANTTLGFKLEEAGMYDIYAALATGSQNYLGGHKFTLDGEEIFKKGMSSIDRSNPDLYGEQIDIHSGSSHLTTVRWVKIATKELAAGGHTLVNDLIKEGNTNGVIDCVRLIPAGMTWSAADFTTMPTTADYHVLEAEAGTLKVTNSNFTTTASTGDKYIFMNQGNYGNYGMQGSTMTFYANEGKYDIWALVGLDDYDNASPRLCDYKFYWGSDETPFAEVSNIKAAAATGWNPLYTTGNLAGEIATYAHWVKVSSGLELSGSKMLTADAGACANGNALGTIDKVLVVPTDWGFVPTTTAPAPVAPEIIYSSFEMTEKAAGATVTATVSGIKKTVDADKSAVVIVAAYKDDVLVDIAFSPVTTLTTAAQDITSAAITLPADITGYTVKAFLWNNLESGMPYVTPIVK